jgi:hypothetical protein
MKSVSGISFADLAKTFTAIFCSTISFAVNRSLAPHYAT